MTKKEQRKLANALLKGLRQSMNEKFNRVPENWDGHELRHWIKDLASEDLAYLKLPRQRGIEYRNDRLIHNL